MGIPQQMNGWIFQRTSELGSGDHALNSSRFPSRFDRAPVYHGLPEISPSELDEFFQVCCRLNSAQFDQSEAVAADMRSLSRKTARSPEGNVDVEPPSSMDDSSMILIEIGVGVDEGLHLNMTIKGRAQSSVKPR